MAAASSLRPIHEYEKRFKRPETSPTSDITIATNGSIAYAHAFMRCS
jgi:hypothetical protein